MIPADRRGSDEQRVRLLSAVPPAPARMVLDTDTANEIDDQFALVHVLLSPDRARLEAVYAAPFAGGRAATPAEGMRKSEAEIHRVLGVLPDRKVPVFAGSECWLTEARGLVPSPVPNPVPSPAADDLIERSGTGDSPLYVVAIGAPTNVASALLACHVRAGRPVEVRAELAWALGAVCDEVLGLDPATLKVEFTQHRGDEMYHPHLGGFNREWDASEGDG